MSEAELRKQLVPGARIVAREAEWRIRSAEITWEGFLRLDLSGLSEVVQGRDARLVLEYEEEGSIQVLKPEETALVVDDSPRGMKTRLLLESLSRQGPLEGEDLVVGNRGLMEKMAYQLDPARKALKREKARILIADTVGLGKTLECGILVSELIRRGMGKRILVVTNRSMMTQFQKEFWARFTIPLVRLDSTGLQKIRQKIPSNHNPFHFYGKSIISIDTLKQPQYQVWLENSHWDIIIIDEAHNVAARGEVHSQKHRLAGLLSTHSDHLILLTATPHDGRKQSFVSLLRMLDASHFAGDDFTREQVEPFVIRRFKQDVAAEIGDAFPDREIQRIWCSPDPAEARVHDALAALSLPSLRSERKAGLARLSLEKALFSSPRACRKSVKERLARTSRSLEDCTDELRKQDLLASIQDLTDLMALLEAITYEDHGKLGELIRLLKELGFRGKAKDDRVVIFTERIETLHFLKEMLPGLLGLKDKALAILHGGMGDVEQQEIVDQFGSLNSDVRILVASDVASEGINLHRACHRMIHFDVPWSLMVFAQRNGRIDRYGQTRKPEIFYLLNESHNEKIKGDVRVLEILIQKDQEARNTTGDPSLVFNEHDVKKEEELVCEAMLSGGTRALQARLDSTQSEQDEFSFLDEVFGVAEAENESSPEEDHRSGLSLFPSDFSYLLEALKVMRRQREQLKDFEVEIFEEDKKVVVYPGRVLQRRMDAGIFELLPKDEGARLQLSADERLVSQEYQAALMNADSWPKINWLWPLHPVFSLVGDAMLNQFGRHSAPVLGLKSYESSCFLMQVSVCNQAGRVLRVNWFGVVFDLAGNFQKLLANPQQELHRLGLLEGEVVVLEGLHEGFLKNLESLRLEAVSRVRGAIRISSGEEAGLLLAAVVSGRVA